MLIRKYYAQHSAITDPREYAYLFDYLPHDVPSLVKIVQGLLVHPAWREACNLPDERHREFYLRSVPQMLKRILQLDSRPLSMERPPEKRKVSICRDWAVLLVSILRHQGVPARLRIGFAGYFISPKPKYVDHRIAEYWSKELERWVLVDAMIDAVRRQRLNLKFDTLNIDSISPFLMAGEVWQRCRTDKANPEEFGDSPDDRGMPPIRYALLHDFDALNKVELIGFDTFHNLINKPEHEVTESERKLLDEIAEITTHVDSRFDDLQTLYQTTSYGQAIQSHLSSLQLL
jgi:excinuclease ABC subunit A